MAAPPGRALQGSPSSPRCWRHGRAHPSRARRGCGHPRDVEAGRAGGERHHAGEQGDAAARAHVERHREDRRAKAFGAAQDRPDRRPGRRASSSAKVQPTAASRPEDAAAERAPVETDPLACLLLVRWVWPCLRHGGEAGRGFRAEHGGDVGLRSSRLLAGGVSDSAAKGSVHRPMSASAGTAPRSARSWRGARARSMPAPQPQRSGLPERLVPDLDHRVERQDADGERHAGEKPGLRLQARADHDQLAPEADSGGMPASESAGMRKASARAGFASHNPPMRRKA